MRTMAMLLSVGVAVAACGGGDDDDDGGGAVADAATADIDADPNAPDADPNAPDAPPGPPPDASTAACAAFGHTAPNIETQRVAEDLPAATGGTIADGTYHQVQNTLYTGSDGETGPAGLTIASTWQVSGNEHGFIVTLNSTNTLHREYTATTNGGMIDFVAQCEDPPGGFLTFDAFTVHSPTSFSLFSTAAGGEAVFELQ